MVIPAAGTGLELFVEIAIGRRWATVLLHAMERSIAIHSVPGSEALVPNGSGDPVTPPSFASLDTGVLLPSDDDHISILGKESLFADVAISPPSAMASTGCRPAPLRIS